MLTLKGEFYAHFLLFVHKTAHFEVICAVCRDIVGLFLCGNMNGSGDRIALLRQLKELIWEKGLPHSVFSFAFHGSAICVKLACNLRQVTSSFDASYKAFG